ncbi:Centaurin-gamma-1A [Borealophlyctis nickersoniae]|nr:Centaurin-gamma-1A [Borealophlyctis nickersoniae]
MEDWIMALQTAITRSLSADEGTIGASKPTFGEMNAAEKAQKDGGQAPQQEFLQSVLSVPGKGRNDIISSMGGGFVMMVRSLALDKWDPESASIMLSIGNEKANEIYEARLKRDETLRDEDKPKPDSDRLAKQRFAVTKYVKKEYVRLPEHAAEFATWSIAQQFSKAVKDSDIPKLLRCLAIGVNPNEKDLSGQTPLHHAILSGNATVSEFLLQWNADGDAQDAQGRTPLHYAAERGDVNLVMMLMKRSVRSDIKDQEGKQAIDIATEKSEEGEGWVKIVTILRLKHPEKPAPESKKPIAAAPPTETFPVDEVSPPPAAAKFTPVSTDFPAWGEAPASLGGDDVSAKVAGTGESAPVVAAPWAPEQEVWGSDEGNT